MARECKKETNIKVNIHELMEPTKCLLNCFYTNAQNVNIDSKFVAEKRIKRLLCVHSK